MVAGMGPGASVVSAVGREGLHRMAQVRYSSCTSR